MRGLAIATVLAVTRLALGDPAVPDEAGAAFLRGRELARLGRFTEACVEFTHSYELDPALGTAVNLADCLERQGQVYRAWVLFDLVARSSPGAQSRARLARQRADALVAKLATVVITVRDPTAPGLAIRIGDHERTPAPEIRDLVEPGDVQIVATVPGRPAFHAALHPAAGATLSIDVPLFWRPAPPSPPPAATPRRRPYLYVAGGLGAAGAIALGTSLVLGLEARSAYHAALDHDCLAMNIVDDAGYAVCRARVDRADARGDHATEVAIAGVALGVAAVAVFFTAPREAVQVTPIASSRALGLGVIGRF